MKWIITLMCIGCVLVGAVGRVGAQDSGYSEYETALIYTAKNDPNMSLFKISVQYDICLKPLILANEPYLPADEFDTLLAHPLYARWFVPEEGMRLDIPAHTPCYTSIDTERQTRLPQIEAEYNVCIEEFYNFLEHTYDGKIIAHLSHDAPPCLDKKGHRLLYYLSDWTYDPSYSYSNIHEWVAGDYSATSYVEAPENITSLGVCLADLQAANPIVKLPYVESEGLFPYLVGMRLFLPESARGCEQIRTKQSLYQISRQYNVCMEAILEASGISMYAQPSDEIILAIPAYAPDCYDEAGKRIGSDETEYRPQAGETFLEIARKHDICMDALWDANPVMDHWDGASYRVPDVVYIPTEKPCAFERKLTTRSNMTLLGLATLTNVCGNRIYDANPQLNLVEYDPYEMPYEPIPAGKTVTVPDRPPCYRLSSQAKVEQIHYMCYAAPVTPESDFSGHIPPITGSNLKALPYCYEYSDVTSIVYNNEVYDIYKRRQNDTYVSMSECLGIDQNKLEAVNKDIPAESRPYYSDYNRILIPQPYDEDCWLLKADDEAYDLHYQQIYDAQAAKAGKLIDGVYTIARWDTWASISYEFGYPWGWLMDANPGVRFDYLEEIRMPWYPSLYTLAAIAKVSGTLLLFGGSFYGLYRWRRWRHGSKKKKDKA